jgi:hypothetical protein
VQLLKDAKARFERTNARGDKHSLAEDGYEEFIHWLDMPWNEQGLEDSDDEDKNW